jgi:hypothetical protein
LSVIHIQSATPSENYTISIVTLDYTIISSDGQHFAPLIRRQKARPGT